MGWRKAKRTLRKGISKRWSSDNIKVKGQTDTPRARTLSDKGFGASVLYREHMKSGGFVKEYPDGKVRIDHPRKIPTTRYKSGNSFVDERIAEMQQSQHWKSEVTGKSGFNQWHYYVAVRGEHYNVLCFFSGNDARFLEIDMIGLIMRSSILYDTDRARKLSGDVTKITWIKAEVIPLPSPRHPP